MARISFFKQSSFKSHLVTSFLKAGELEVDLENLHIPGQKVFMFQIAIGSTCTCHC